MSEVWAVIVSIIILMVIYGYVSSKLSDRKKVKKRGESIPLINESIKTEQLYVVYLSDGRKFEEVKFLGEIINEEGMFVLGGYEGMVVLQRNDKKIYVRKQAIRLVEEI